jgi:hypothetical protein
MPILPEEPFWTPSRVLSGIVVLLYMVVAYVARDGEESVRMFVFCVCPMFCVWFPDAMGQHLLRQRGQHGYDPNAPPGFFVHAFGWFLLVLLPPILWLFERR